jgi:hypothetical protein
MKKWSGAAIASFQGKLYTPLMASDMAVPPHGRHEAGDCGRDEAQYIVLRQRYHFKPSFGAVDPAAAAI